MKTKTQSSSTESLFCTWSPPPPPPCPYPPPVTKSASLVKGKATESPGFQSQHHHLLIVTSQAGYPLPEPPLEPSVNISSRRPSKMGLKNRYSIIHAD